MVNNITYHQLVDVFQDFVNRHFQLKGFYTGELDQIMNQQNLYPLLACIPDVSTYKKETNVNYNVMEYKFNVFVCDIIKSDQINQIEVLSDCMQICQDLMSELDNVDFYRDNNIDVEYDIQMTPFIERFDDMTGGWNMNITIIAPVRSRPCMNPVSTKENNIIISE